MAFFDKLNDFAKNISDKTTDVIETGKLQNQVNTEKNLAGEELKKIGEVYYTRWVQHGEAVPEVLEFCNAAKAHYDAADAALAEISRIRAESEAAKAAAAAAAAAQPMQPTAAGPVCPGCGTANEPGTRFCCNCGTKIEPPAVPMPKFCVNCGAEIAAGMRFCGGCGTRTE